MASNPTDEEGDHVEPRFSGLTWAGLFLLSLAVVALVLGWRSDPADVPADVAITWLVSILVLASTLGYASREPESPGNGAVARQKYARVVAWQETALAFVSGAVSVLALILGLIVTRANDSERIALLVMVTIFTLGGTVACRATVGRAVAARRQRIIEDAILHEVDKRIAAHADEVDKRIAELSARLTSGCEADSDRLAPAPPRRRRGLLLATLAGLRR